MNPETDADRKATFCSLEMRTTQASRTHSGEFVSMTTATSVDGKRGNNSEYPLSYYVYIIFISSDVAAVK